MEYPEITLQSYALFSSSYLCLKKNKTILKLSDFLAFSLSLCIHDSSLYSSLSRTPLLLHLKSKHYGQQLWVDSWRASHKIWA